MASLKSSADLEKMIKHKGRAYKCLRCHHKGQMVIDVRGRIEDHILKEHLSNDQLPFFCRLCNFRCADEGHLVRHITKYQRHVKLVREMNLTDSTPYLVRNPQPYLLGLADWTVLSKEESRRVFLEKAQPKGRDILQEAVDAVFPDDVLDALEGPEAPSSTPDAPAAITKETDQAAPTRQSLPSEGAPPTSKMPPPAHGTTKKKALLSDDQPLDLSTPAIMTQDKEEEEEDILPQLLGEGDEKDSLSVKAETPQHGEGALDATKWQEVIKVLTEQTNTIKRLTEAVESNSRTIRCLEKTIKSQHETITNLIKDREARPFPLPQRRPPYWRPIRNHDGKEANQDHQNRKPHRERSRSPLAQPRLKSTLGRVFGDDRRHRR